MDTRYTILANENNAGVYKFGRFGIKPDLNVKKLLLQNGGTKSVNVTISLSFSGNVPSTPNDIKYTLKRGEQIVLAINSSGRMQYIWLTDDRNNILGSVHPIRFGATDMAIQEGEENWFIQDFFQT